MKTHTHELRYYIATHEALTPEDAALVEAAKAATYTSYSPYSHFRVGAAVRLENGEIIQGSNQENAAYSPTICAERCAMFYANAHHPDIVPTAIAIAARGTDGNFTPQPVSPCGVCRQVLVETQQRYGHPLRVLLVGDKEIYLFDSIIDVLAFQFDEGSL